MEIMLNNRPETIEGKSAMSVSELIKFKNYTFKFLAVRINSKPVSPDQFDSTTIKDGDAVIVMHLISGG